VSSASIHETEADSLVSLKASDLSGSCQDKQLMGEVQSQGVMGKEEQDKEILVVALVTITNHKEAEQVA
jgi:hypothetical protein